MTNHIELMKRAWKCREKKLFIPSDMKKYIKAEIRARGYTIKGYCENRGISDNAVKQGYFSDRTIRILLKDGIISNEAIA